MQREIVISGFGGQGVLLAGQLLAYAGMYDGYHVTWLPSYGPEMRGGTAHCTVVIADEEIGSPLVRRPGIVLAFNNPSAEKYGELVRPGGLVLYNSSLVSHHFDRHDATFVAVPASQLAEESGNPLVLNMVMLGALVASTNCVRRSSVQRALAEHLSRRELLDANLAALARGAATAAPDG
jgi:2-oxoglutarate ferredoxin oxidoreductase subunit gamma